MCGSIEPGSDAVSPAQQAEQGRWRDLARAAGGWLFETDADLRFRWVSGPYPPYTDEAGEAVIGQKVLDAPLLGADGQARPDGLRLRARLADPTPLVDVLTAWNVTGEQRIVACQAVPYCRADGALAGWRGSARDVTDLLNAQAQARVRREASFEERLAHAAAQSGLGFAELDVGSGRMAFDAVACSNHGLPFPHPPYSAQDWLGAVHEADRAQATAALNEALSSTGHMEARYRFVRPDGSQPWLEVIATVRRDESGRPTLVTGTCRDVTAQVVAERLRQEKETAERASQAKSEVVARVSHELRTPLNAILGLAQLMALDGEHLSAAQRTRVAGIEDAGRRLLALVNDMLDVARLEQGGQALARERVDLAEAWRRVVALVQPLATPRQVTLASWPAGPQWVWADAGAVEQVLINLLSNAIKYNREGGRVWVELGGVADGPLGDGGLLRLTLCDEGQGMDEGQLAQLFQPFKRLGGERQRIEGTGLGLVIARKLAEAMQGRLEAASEPGRGSRFSLSLPMAQA